MNKRIEFISPEEFAKKKKDLEKLKIYIGLFDEVMITTFMGIGIFLSFTMAGQPLSFSMFFSFVLTSLVSKIHIFKR